MVTNKEKWLFITLGSIGTAAISIAFIYRNQVRNVVGKVIDYVFAADTEEELKKLHPKAQPIFRSFIHDIEKMGYKVRVTDGYRTFQESIKLKTDNDLNAKAGFSLHNYGMAVDINISYGNNWLRKSSSKADWEKTGIPQYAKKKYNLRWGGDFRGYHDPIHFDLENIYPVNKLYAQAVKQFGSAEKAEGNKVNIA